MLEYIASLIFKLLGKAKNASIQIMIKTFSGEGHPWTPTLPLDGFHTHQNPLSSGYATHVTSKIEYYVFSYILLTKLIT